MTTVNNIKELSKYLNKHMKEVLEENVAPVVKNKEQEKVITEVYDRYSPSTPDGEPFKYERRGYNGGLADQKNMQHKVKTTKDGVELSVENVTKGKDQNFRLDTLIEYGDGTDGKEYQYKTNRDGTANQYLQGRPFTKSTIEELEQSGEHIQAFVRGMKTKGIEID
ncbi:hypothetical protein [Bacillus xiapuensis]|uniref:Phage protein n=1 Tax=Bacillus xiapuensis TaxID=2014075 RepID=A0ABU6N7S9_9BACI|nr:hypothetical protein [Bacillus xiapuensis]